LVRRIQPGALIMGRDFYEAEKSFKNFGYLDDAGRPQFFPLSPPAAGAWPFEVCDTINDSWFYNPENVAYRPTPEILRKFVEIIGRGGNYLLDIGPKPSGQVEPAQERRLREIGAWLKKNGEAVYGTRPGPFAPAEWGFPVQKDGRVYLHILNWPGAELVVSDAQREVKAVKSVNGRRIRFRQNEGRLSIDLGDVARDPVDTIVVLDLAR
jgi:alpha-L-fucosidase